MQARISKWGNSLAVRLPKEMAERLSLKEGQTVNISIEDQAIKVQPIVTRHYPTLEEMVAEARRLGPENEPPFEDWGILPSEWPSYEDQGDGRK